MTLTPYDPWRNFPSVTRLSDQFFDRALRDFLRDAPKGNGAGWSPAVDVKETETAYVIHADIPGVEPSEIDVSFEDGALTISGERSSERTEDKEGAHIIERSYGSFERRFALPDSVDIEAIQANGKNGVLEITVPKKEGHAKKRIPVS